MVKYLKKKKTYVSHDKWCLYTVDTNLSIMYNI